MNFFHCHCSFHRAPTGPMPVQHIHRKAWAWLHACTARRGAHLEEHGAGRRARQRQHVAHVEVCHALHTCTATHPTRTRTLCAPTPLPCALRAAQPLAAVPSMHAAHPACPSEAGAKQYKAPCFPACVSCRQTGCPAAEQIPPGAGVLGTGLATPAICSSSCTTRGWLKPHISCASLAGRRAKPRTRCTPATTASQAARRRW